MTLPPGPATRRACRVAATFALALLFVAGCLVSPGCLVGPDYRPPAPVAPADWASLATRPTGPAATQVSVVTADPADTVRWWQQFDDRTLDRLVRESLAANLDVAQAIARVRQARASRAIAVGGLFPSVDLAGSYRRTGRGDSGGTTVTDSALGATGGGGSGGSRNDQFQLGFDAAWEIDVFGGLRREVEASDADIRAAVDDLQNVRVTLVSEVAVNYFALRSAQQRTAFAERNLGIQRKSLDLTKRRVVGGFLSRLDLANAEAQVASTEAAIPALQQAARSSIFDLALLLGREPASLVDALSPGSPIPPTPPVVPAGLPMDVLRRRPDVRRAEEQLHAATARIGVATADWFPRVTLNGSFGSDANRAKGLFNYGNTLWSVGPNVSWNIFDAGRIRANIVLTEARQQELLAAYRQVVLTAFRDAEQALTAYDYEQRRRVSLRASAEANRRAVQIAQTLYAQGQTDFVNVLTAQQGLLSSEDAMVQSDQQVAANLVAIYKALGGGWEDPAPGTPQPGAATQPATDLPPVTATPPVADTQPAVATQPAAATRPAADPGM
jgi:multidrug efflux system outer membrane protein